MGQGLAQAFVGVQQAGILADHGDGDLAFRVVDGLHHPFPAAHVRLAVEGQVEVPQHFAVQPLGVVVQGHFVDRAAVQRRNYAFRPHVAEQRDLLALILGYRPVAAAQQNLRLDADTQQFLDRMLRGLGLQLPGGGDVGHQGQVHEQAAGRAELVRQLADGFEEGQRFDVADGAADLHQDEVQVVGIGLDAFLDLVGDVRNHLDRPAQVVAAAFRVDDLAVDPPGGPVVRLGGVDAGEAFVVAEVEVGFRPVIGHEDLAVLERGHRPRVHVEVGVELAEPHLVATGLQRRGERRGCNALAEGGDHAAGDEYEPRHGRPS